MSQSNIMFAFANGLNVPALGLGTGLSSRDTVGEAVERAIDVGYRHFDCAALYGNEKEIGDALKKKINQVNLKN